MLKAIWNRLEERRDEEGFTLIELMVVVLIIGILVAIAVPSFLGARDRANNRAAQTNVTTALKAEKTFFVDAQAYSAVIADMEAISPELTYIIAPAAVTDADAGDNEVFLVTATANGNAGHLVIMASESASGTVYCIGDIATGTDAGTYYATACDGTEDEAAVAAWATSAGAGW